MFVDDLWDSLAAEAASADAAAVATKITPKEGKAGPPKSMFVDDLWDLLAAEAAASADAATVATKITPKEGNEVAKEAAKQTAAEQAEATEKGRKK